MPRPTITLALGEAKRIVAHKEGGNGLTRR